MTNGSPNVLPTVNPLCTTPAFHATVSTLDCLFFFRRRRTENPRFTATKNVSSHFAGPLSFRETWTWSWNILRANYCCRRRRRHETPGWIHAHNGWIWFMCMHLFSRRALAIRCWLYCMCSTRAQCLSPFGICLGRMHFLLLGCYTLHLRCMHGFV